MPPHRTGSLKASHPFTFPADMEQSLTLNGYGRAHHSAFEHGMTTMTFLIAMTIGIATGAMRSIISIVLVSLMLSLGGLVMLAMPGPWSLLSLLTALMGYQVGLINCLIVSLALSKRKGTVVTVRDTAKSPIANPSAMR